MGTPFTKAANTSGLANPYSQSTSRAVTPERNDLVSSPDTETSMVPTPMFDDSVEIDMMPTTKKEFLALKTIFAGFKKMVGAGGIEPPTSTVSR
tara:strand:+ start:507 stop:788 length:282 start_codon:yes stop_codon:yes gene_type:complete